MLTRAMSNPAVVALCNVIARERREMLRAIREGNTITAECAHARKAAVTDVALDFARDMIPDAERYAFLTACAIEP